MSFFAKFKDEIVALLETRLFFLALGALMGSGGNVQSLIDTLKAIAGM